MLQKYKTQIDSEKEKQTTGTNSGTKNTNMSPEEIDLIP